MNLFVVVLCSPMKKFNIYYHNERDVVNWNALSTVKGRGQPVVT
jgi:hypothetical protein